MMRKNDNNLNHPKECKCKLLPLSLSATSAAEFGDLASLQHRIATSKYKDNERQRTTRLLKETQQLHSIPEPLSAGNNNDGVNKMKDRSNDMSTSNSITSGYSSSITNNTSTPLHLAAQNGHTAITSYLLQNGYDADTGLLLSTINYNAHDGETVVPLLLEQRKLCTPLHRACHSGSLTCIKLLLDHGANDMAVDYSMYDGMTPLHKTIKGGRYLAVALLLNHFRRKDITHCNVDTDIHGNNKNQGFLRQALDATDKRNKTPLDLALELQSHGEEEVRSVSRWDSVAGGEANFDLCVSLLRDAAEECKMNEQRNALGSDTEAIATVTTSTTNASHSSSPQKNEGKSTSSGTLQSFLDPDNLLPVCDCNDGDQCKTLAWESAFQSALLQSTQAILKEKTLMTGKSTTQIKQNDHKVPRKSSTDENENINDKKVKDRHEEATIINDVSNHDISTLNLGVVCEKCGHKTFSLFHFQQKYLLCKKCLKNMKRRTYGMQ